MGGTKLMLIRQSDTFSSRQSGRRRQTLRNQSPANQALEGTGGEGDFFVCGGGGGGGVRSHSLLGFKRTANRFSKCRQFIMTHVSMRKLLRNVFVPASPPSPPFPDLKFYKRRLPEVLSI